MKNVFLYSLLTVFFFSQNVFAAPTTKKATSKPVVIIGNNVPQIKKARALLSKLLVMVRKSRQADAFAALNWFKDHMSLSRYQAIDSSVLAVHLPSKKRPAVRFYYITKKDMKRFKNIHVVKKLSEGNARGGYSCYQKSLFIPESADWTKTFQLIVFLHEILHTYNHLGKKVRKCLKPKKPIRTKKQYRAFAKKRFLESMKDETRVRVVLLKFLKALWKKKFSDLLEQMRKKIVLRGYKQPLYNSKKAILAFLWQLRVMEREVASGRAKHLFKPFDLVLDSLFGKPKSHAEMVQRTMFIFRLAVFHTCEKSPLLQQKPYTPFAIQYNFLRYTLKTG
ncbi:hypothetical protein KKH43_06620 [Patescibacteria group bacterium]|nr:hypothetical protein [Patescibacteria group bacterium]